MRDGRGRGRPAIGQRPLLQRQRVGVPPQAGVSRGQAAQPDRSAGVLGAEGSLANSQCPLLQAQRLAVPPSVAARKDAGQVAQPDRGVGVIGAEGGLGNSQRPLGERQRVGVPPQAGVSGGQIGQGGSRLGVIGAEGGLGNSQRSFLELVPEQGRLIHQAGVPGASELPGRIGRVAPDRHFPRRWHGRPLAREGEYPVREHCRNVQPPGFRRRWLSRRASTCPEDWPAPPACRARQRDHQSATQRCCQARTRPCQQLRRDCESHCA